MANRDEMSFGRAFADARKEMGSGKTFTWRGNKYTTNLAEEESGSSTGSMRPQARPSRAPEESPRPTARRRVERDPQDASPTTRARPPVQRDAQDASPTTRARTPVRRDTQDMSPTRSAVGEVPASIQRLLDEAPGGAARARAERIADQVRAGRMPLREAIDKINALFSGITSPMAGRNEEMRQRRAAAGMARGGMVKNGNTDRRGKGMFYDSKSPRGYK